MLHLLFHVLLLPSFLLAAQPPQDCTSPSESLPNPLTGYPATVGTGTANGTIAILPIPYATARKIVPSEYPILKNAYKALFPGWVEKGIFPMYIAMIQDHDIKQGGKPAAPDFSRASLIFPFIDRLNNGHTPFRYGSPILISPNPVVAANEPALQETYVGSFDPPCAAYAAVPGGHGGVTYMNAWAGDAQARGQKPSFETQFAKVAKVPYEFSTFENITNQPLFGNGTVPDICDAFVELYNTTLTTGVNVPVPVVGQVTVLPPFFSSKKVWSGVFGFRYDGAWVDRPGLPCTSLAG
ncbi:MAG: hypothetical protein Q9191_008393 [Dirinaria sp. TL-2023a]